jgi:hypothetical protein
VSPADEEYTIHCPSGDQTGPWSGPGVVTSGRISRVPTVMTEMFPVSIDVISGVA